MCALKSTPMVEFTVDTYYLAVIMERANHTRLHTTATFDVQSATADVTGDNEVTVTGEFIKNTTATGCLLVLQSEDGAPDVFRALLRPDSSTTLTSTVTVPSSTYTVSVHDLEQDGLPNSRPAYTGSSGVSVHGAGECVCCSVQCSELSVTVKLPLQIQSLAQCPTL